MKDSYLPFKIDGTAYAVPVEYVFSVLSASENFPSCVPPGLPAYVKRVIITEGNLVPVIEWNQVAQVDAQNGTKSRIMLVILHHKNRMLGVLADCVAAPFTLAEPKLEPDATKTYTLMLYGNEHYILFDIPEFFQNEVI